MYFQRSEKSGFFCQVMMYLPAIFVTQTFGKSKDPDPKLAEAFGSLPCLGYGQKNA